MTSAHGWEEDGITTLVFRKPLHANGPTDHSIEEAEMHVIWATGQEQGGYSHSPGSGLESKKEDGHPSPLSNLGRGWPPLAALERGEKIIHE